MYGLVIALFIVTQCLFFSSLPLSYAGDDPQKYVIVIFDGKSNGLSDESIAALARHTAVKLSVAWPPGVVPSEAMSALVKEQRVEPVLTLPDEPVLPLLYETRLSSPVPIEFSWPADARDILARAQETFFTGFGRDLLGFPRYANGIRLRSGAVSPPLVDDLTRLGITWACVEGGEGSTGVYRSANFMIVSGMRGFSDAGALCDYVLSSSAPVTAVLLEGKGPSVPAFLAGLGQCLSENPSLAMTTPSRLPPEVMQSLPVVDGRVPEQDYRRWLAQPGVWYRLSSARTAIEEYKNSGQADLKILDALRDEMYCLYRFDLLARIQREGHLGDEQLFQAGLNNIFRLLNRTPPFDITGRPGALPEGSAPSLSIVDAGADRLAIVNAVAVSSTVPSIEQFSVLLGSDTITYSVALSGAADPRALMVDVYMDLNHRRGAGMTSLLDGGPDALIEAKDAWEFAFRIEKGDVSLFRSGRFKPVLAKQLKARKGVFEIEIPRGLLRGNPLQWGYQAVLATRKGDRAEMLDFLRPEDRLREKIAGQFQVRLSAVRAIPSSGVAAESDGDPVVP